jgi:predicted secreted Zn-dependent protease
MNRTVGFAVVALLLAGLAWKIFTMLNIIVDAKEPTLVRASEFHNVWEDEPVTDPVLAETLVRGVQVSYYDIAGDAWQELQQSLETYTQLHGGFEGATFGHLTWRPGNVSDGVCGATSGILQADDMRMMMPRWTPTAGVTPGAKQWWAHFIHKLARHEQGHVDVTLAAAASGTPEMRASTCATADITLNAINRRLETAQEQYDATHGGKGSTLAFG